MTSYLSIGSYIFLYICFTLSYIRSCIINKAFAKGKMKDTRFLDIRELVFVNFILSFHFFLIFD